MVAQGFDYDQPHFLQNRVSMFFTCHDLLPIRTGNLARMSQI